MQARIYISGSSKYVGIVLVWMSCCCWSCRYAEVSIASGRRPTPARACGNACYQTKLVYSDHHAAVVCGGNTQLEVCWSDTHHPQQPADHPPRSWLIINLINHIFFIDDDDLLVSFNKTNKVAQDAPFLVQLSIFLEVDSDTPSQLPIFLSLPSFPQLTYMGKTSSIDIRMQYWYALSTLSIYMY